MQKHGSVTHPITIINNFTIIIVVLLILLSNRSKDPNLPARQAFWTGRYFSRFVLNVLEIFENPLTVRFEIIPTESQFEVIDLSKQPPPVQIVFRGKPDSAEKFYAALPDDFFFFSERQRIPRKMISIFTSTYIR